MPSGVLLSITWDHASLPGVKSRRVIIWSVDARNKGDAPTSLAGRPALNAIQVAMTSTEQH